MTVPITTIESPSVTSVAVYCGSSTGKHPAYALAAQSLGTALAKADRRLIYGGGTQGLMGAVARSLLASGGKATGITLQAFMEHGGEGEKAPEKSAQVAVPNGFLAPGKEVVVESLHARKFAMASRSCGFIALPGGFGTYDEVFESTTWTQIGLQNKLIVNVRGFYESLKQQIRTAIEDGFVESYNESLVVFVDGPEDKEEHETFDWGDAAISALDRWHEKRSKLPRPAFDWDSGKTATVRTT
ncbi:hypothetical protein V5O48_001600 [Marasmius crinis-equi]|uniref:Cytokinin riboside 5'-monophosphate phosphoribohydrolase n=1 Tax=Marasmius crinis-equi TaxID=585013 RepID=A0ABR3FY30_9AGAR